MNNDTEQQLKPCHLDIPSEIIEAANKLDTWFKRQGTERWEFMNVKSRAPDPFKAQLLEWLKDRVGVIDRNFPATRGKILIGELNRIIEYVQTH